MLRQARIILAALLVTRCFAASLPRPEEAPVIITVFPVKGIVGLGMLIRSWTLKKSRAERAMVGVDVY